MVVSKVIKDHKGISFWKSSQFKMFQGIFLLLLFKHTQVVLIILNSRWDNKYDQAKWP